MPHPAPKDKRAVSADGSISVSYLRFCSSHDRMGGVYEVKIGKPWVEERDISGSFLVDPGYTLSAKVEAYASKEGIDYDALSLSEKRSFRHEFCRDNGFCYGISEFLIDLACIRDGKRDVFIDTVCELFFSISEELYVFEGSSGFKLKDRYPVEIDFSPTYIGPQERRPSRDYQKAYFKTYHFIRGA